MTEAYGVLRRSGGSFFMKAKDIVQGLTRALAYATLLAIFLRPNEHKKVKITTEIDEHQLSRLMLAKIYQSVSF